MALIIPVAQPTILCTATTHPDRFGEDGMTLEAMQAVVGGYIEHVYLNPTRVIDGVTYVHLIVNEEGKLDRLPTNAVATAIARLGGLVDVIVGPAILLTDEEFQ